MHWTQRVESVDRSQLPNQERAFQCKNKGSHRAFGGRRKQQGRDQRISPWLSSLLHMGSTCMKGPSFWCSASSSAKYWLHKKPNKPMNHQCQSYHSIINRLNQTRKGGQISNLGISNRWTKQGRNPCAALPINIRIASNLRGEVSRRGEPLAIEPRHGGSSGEWGLQSRMRRGDWDGWIRSPGSGGEARRWCARCGVVGREVKRLAALGCSLQSSQRRGRRERGRGVGRQPLPLWKPFLSLQGCNTTPMEIWIKTKYNNKWENMRKRLFLFSWVTSTSLCLQVCCTLVFLFVKNNFFLFFLKVRVVPSPPLNIFLAR